MIGSNHCKRPDGDNLEKYVNDCLTGIVWKDDAQISWILRSKTYVDHPTGFIDIYVKEIGEMADYELISEIIGQRMEGV